MFPISKNKFYCKKKKTICSFLHGIYQVKKMKQFKCKFNKVASIMLTNLDLLKVIAKERKKHLFPLYGNYKRYSYGT